MTAREWPLVSAITPAYNAGAYLREALDSALAQDYPADRLELVVVDDGSSDETPEILAEYTSRHPDRIRVVRQDNHGVVSATARAIAAARGELLALLDADDVWLAHKTRSQVELMRAEPRLVVVHGEMRIIEADGALRHPSLFAHHYGRPPARGRLLAELMGANHATGSSIMVRASLRPLFAHPPAGDHVTIQDWWVVARAAIAGEVDYLSDPCALYRFHGANASAGASGSQLVRWTRRELMQQRWMLAHVSPRHGLTAAELVRLTAALGERALRVFHAAGSPFARLIEVTDSEARAAVEALTAGTAALATGDLPTAAHALARSFALDPYDDAAREAIAALADRVAAAPSPAPRSPLLAGARRFRTVTTVRDLLAVPELLRDYARCFTGADDATLVILTDHEGDIDSLLELVTSAGLGGDDGADLLAIGDPLDDAGEAAIVRDADAALASGPSVPLERLPLPPFGVDAMGALREFAEVCWAT